MTMTIGELFDPTADFVVDERLRPHWSQAGAIVFITFRTIDSIPKEVVDRWALQKNEWLDRRNLLNGQHWTDAIANLDPKTLCEFKKHFDRCREQFLDTCQGRCLLRNPALSQIVADSLMHFDTLRYRMGDFIVMPNHVHLLAAFPTPEAMRTQLDSWTHYTAFRIHQQIGEKGRFWQQEPFDHLVRSIEQYDYLKRYIAENPKAANLNPGEYHYYEA